MALKKINKNAQGVPTGEYTDVAGGTLYADVGIGTILPYGGTSDKIPQGYLLCDGTSLLRASYPELFAVIGTSFGAGNGTTTFNIPDLRGKVPVGLNSSDTEFNALGKTGGEKKHLLTKAEMPAHSHTFMGGWADGSSYSERFAYGSVANKNDKYGIGTEGGSQAHNNLQPYNTVNFIIKAVQVALPADLEAAIESMFAYKDYNGMKYRIIGKSFEAYGYLSSSSSSSGLTVDLPVTMADANYSVVATNNNPDSSAALNAPTFAVSKTTTGFKIGFYGTAGPIAYQINGIIA